jgi:hypothetical protein
MEVEWFRYMTLLNTAAGYARIIPTRRDALSVNIRKAIRLIRGSFLDINQGRD